MPSEARQKLGEIKFYLMLRSKKNVVLNRIGEGTWPPCPLPRIRYCLKRGHLDK